jgi:hypothetical protein
LVLVYLVLLALALLVNAPHLLQKLVCVLSPHCLLQLLAQHPHPPLLVCVLELAPMLVCVLVCVLAPQLLQVCAVHFWVLVLPLALLLLLQLLLACVPALLVSYLLLPMPH